jgi:hypothetical protein
MPRENDAQTPGARNGEGVDHLGQYRRSAIHLTDDAYLHVVHNQRQAIGTAYVGQATRHVQAHVSHHGDSLPPLSTIAAAATSVEGARFYNGQICPHLAQGSPVSPSTAFWRIPSVHQINLKVRMGSRVGKARKSQLVTTKRL